MSYPNRAAHVNKLYFTSLLLPGFFFESDMTTSKHTPDKADTGAAMSILGARPFPVARHGA